MLKSTLVHKMFFLRFLPYKQRKIWNQEPNECGIFSSCKFSREIKTVISKFLSFNDFFFQKCVSFLPCKQRKIWNQEPNECASGHDCDRDAYVHAHVRRRT